VVYSIISSQNHSLCTFISVLRPTALFMRISHLTKIHLQDSTLCPKQPCPPIQTPVDERKSMWRSSL